MKKISLLLTFTMLVLSIIPSISYGENNYDKKLEENIVKAKELFNISSDYDKFNSNVNSYESNTTFNLNWRDTSKKLNNINITMDLDGNIISYDSYPEIYKEPTTKSPKNTKEELEKAALDFIKRISPDIRNSIKIQLNTYPIYPNDTNYSFTYVRYVNDIKYAQNTVNITLDKYTGKVINYYVNWDRNIEFPKIDKAMKLDKAKELFKEKLGLKPIYKWSRPYRPVDIREDMGDYYLAYSPLDYNQGIDAITGEKTNIDYYGSFRNDKMSAEGGLGSEGLTPAEQGEVDKLKSLFDSETAEQKMRQLVDIGDNYKAKSKSLYSDYNNPNQYRWNISFSKDENGNQMSFIDVSIDAKSGELLNFYKSLNYSETEKPTITKEKSIEIAKSYLNKQNPEKKEQIEFMENQYEYGENDGEPKTYNFQFIRKIDNVYVENDNIYIGVDAIKGEVYSYSVAWFKGEFPSRKNIISLDKAYEILWNKIGLELMYIKNFDEKGNIIKTKLVYVLNSERPPIISAITGELLDYSGKPYSERQNINYSDIEKSYAKDKIKALAEYGIGFVGEKFLPNAEIKQSEYIYLLWKSINQYRTDQPNEEDMYNDFIRMGYMEEYEKAPQRIVTKGEGVKYIIRMMNLREVAEIKGIYSDIFKDGKSIKQEFKGYINIAYGLNIIKGNGTGNIEVEYGLKRQDAANMVYNYLFR